MVETKEGRMIDFEGADIVSKKESPSPTGDGDARVCEVWFDMQDGGGVFEP